jgi:N-acyl-D-aspartate/D-glutamate deacylase
MSNNSKEKGTNENGNTISRRGFLKKSMLLSGSTGLTLLGGGAVAGLFQSCTKKEKFDTIIANGLIYCGDGKKPINGSIGIKEGRITAIGDLGDLDDLKSNYKTVIDALGHAVSPGFIDIHTHSDTNFFNAPLGDSRIYQGITTDVGGNCGDSPFPYSDEQYEAKKGTLRYGYPYWQDIEGFYNALEKNKIGINYMSYVGFGMIRSAVIGKNNVQPNADQLKKMCSILDKEMENGAVGMSCGLEYTPDAYASTDEIAELCKIVAKHNGLFAIHMRNEDDRVEEAITEAITIAKKANVRLQISHLKAQNEPNWNKLPNMLKLIDEAKASGIDIAFDRYPYVAFSTGLTSFIPTDLRQGSSEEILARLKDPKISAQIGKYSDSRVARLGGPQNVLIAACSNPDNAKYSGKNIAECCKISGMEPWEMIKYLLVSENLGVQMAGFAMKEENLQSIYSHPLSMPASDGSVYSPEGPLGKEMPHPRSYGTFPRFLGKYCREDKIIDWSTAIYKCTGLPASRLQLKDRGLISLGYAADIVVFDKDKIKDSADYINPHQFADGIEHVFVNGDHTIENKKFIGQLNGKIL